MVLDYICGPSEIAPGVYVGNANTASDAQFFKEKNIIRVVNCTPYVPCFFSQTVQYMRIPVYDLDDIEENQLMLTAIPDAIDFILEAAPNSSRGVLIHCQVGVSRSATVAVALLRHCCFATLPEAFSAVVKRRKIAFFGGWRVNFKSALYSYFDS